MGTLDGFTSQRTVSLTVLCFLGMESEKDYILLGPEFGNLHYIVFNIELTNRHITRKMHLVEHFGNSKQTWGFKSSYKLVA